jgi:aspartate aminotransferase-like enzyme
MARKGYLMTPGPTPIPERVEAAMAQPIIYHRGPEFRALLGRVLPRLAQVFQTANEVALLTGSGTAAMESAVANLCSPGDRVLVVSAGNFGERWAKIAAAYRCDVAEVRYPWGETPDPADVRARLAELGGARAVYCTHAETSTGVVADVRAIAAAARQAGALTVVDAISSLGALPLEQDAWALDVVVSGSQKALMTPPGLAFASASGDALKVAGTATSPRFYLDWQRTLEGQAELRPPFTPAVSLVFGLEAALELLLVDGLEAAWERSRRLGRACRAGVKAMGLELFSPDEDRSAVVTAIRVPRGVDAAAAVRSMWERSGVTVAGGQGELKGRVVRIGHVGYIDLEDVVTALGVLGRAFAEQGVDVEVDRGLERAREAHQADHASARAGHVSPR